MKQNKNIGAYMMIGELAGMPTRFSEVRLFDYDTFNMKWVNELELLNLMGNGSNIVNMNTLSTNTYRIPVYKIAGDRRMMIPQKSVPEMGVALAIVTQSINSNMMMGLLIYRAPNKIQFIKTGQSTRYLDNIQNMKISIPEGMNVSGINEWSLVYADTLPTLPISALANKKSKIEVFNEHIPYWEKNQK